MNAEIVRHENWDHVTLRRWSHHWHPGTQVVREVECLFGDRDDDEDDAAALIMMMEQKLEHVGQE